MSPRHVPASVTELSRVGLLTSLPGQTLTRLAERMRREDVPAGRTIVAEGDGGDRFYVLLLGLAAVTQSERGARSVLRPGETFGEVALAMGIPRTATVTAMTPSVVASCDRETFDELLRPLFAEDLTPRFGVGCEALRPRQRAPFWVCPRHRRGVRARDSASAESRFAQLLSRPG